MNTNATQSAYGHVPHPLIKYSGSSPDEILESTAHALTALSNHYEGIPNQRFTQLSHNNLLTR